jgi:hypothetical protein
VEPSTMAVSFRGNSKIRRLIHLAWFMLRECFRHSTCSTNRIFEDVPRNVPTLWMFTLPDGKYTQCWNCARSILKKKKRFVIYAAWFMFRECFRHAACSTNRIFEDVPRNVPTLWMFTLPDGKYTQCWDCARSILKKKRFVIYAAWFMFRECFRHSGCSTNPRFENERSTTQPPHCGWLSRG